MKKPPSSTLFIIAGLLCLLAALRVEDINYAFAGIGFGLITIGISQRKKESESEGNSADDTTEKESTSN